MDVEQARFNMIEQQIRPWEVLDGGVLDLLRSMRREDFVPAEHQALTFVDMQIPLKPGEEALAAGQVMLEPKVEARMLQDLQIRRSDKVLEIGTGSGFMAALLGRMAQRVITLEIDATLAETARANLQKAGLQNVEVRCADGATTDLAADGPFDVIVLSGAVAQIPESLLALLNPEGGRLMAIVGGEPIMRATLVRHMGHGLASQQPWDTFAPLLLHFPAPDRFKF